MAVFTTLSFIQVSRQLRTQNQRQLQQAAKSQGLAIYERLTILDSDLQMASLRLQHGDPVSSRSNNDELPFRTMAAWKSQGGAGGNPFLTMTASEKNHLLSGKALVRMAPCSTTEAVKCISMARMIDFNHAASGLIVGEVNSNYLWSPDGLPADVDLFVLDPQNEVLYISSPDKTSAAVIASQRNSSGFF